MSKGLGLLRKACRSVHMAMTELASILENGEFGLRPDTAKAFDLFRRAVRFGSVVARFHVGRCLHFGIGTTKDRAKAAGLFRSAERLGFPLPKGM